MESVYDRALSEIGSDKKYQKCFSFIYIIILIGCWAMSYLNIILAITIVPHTCKLPLKPNNISEIDWKFLHIPRNKDINGRLKFDSCTIYSNPNEINNTVECKEYSYDHKWYDSTAPSEYNWVCDKEINIANILAYTKIGEIFGSMVFGWFGDVYGRRLTYIISIIMIFIGRAISVAAGNSYLIFLIGCMIAYFPSWSVPQSLTLTAMEISSPKLRTSISMLRFISFSTGCVIMAFIYWWLRNWKIFLIVTTVPLVPFILLSWKMIESPRWLFTQGRVQECVEIFKKVAKTNNRPLKTSTEQELFNDATIQKASNLGFLALFSGKTLARNTFAQMIIWIASTSSYAVLLLTSGAESERNPFLDFAWQSIADIPSMFVAAWIADRYGRRYAAGSSFIVMSVVWACLALRESTTNAWIQSWWMLSLLRIIVRLFTSITYFVINLLNIELYPTCLRQSGMALGNITSGVSSAICPYILHLGRRFDPRLPSVMLMITSILGIISTTVIPETLNAKLPETLEESKNFGRKNKNVEEPQLVPLHP